MDDKNKTIKPKRVTLGKMMTNDKESSGDRRGGLPVWALVVICAAALTVIALVLYFVVFAGGRQAPPETAPATAASATPEPTPSQQPTPSPTRVPTATPAPTPSTMWGAKFPGKFTDGEVVKDESSYRSANISVDITNVQKDGVTYFLADIYITDLKYFRSAFASGKYKGEREYVYKIAQDNNAVIAINGDYYKVNAGPVFKNGEAYRDSVLKDVLVMFKDGTMRTYESGEFEMDKLKADAWQMWTWGPMLLRDGKPMTEFNLPDSIGGFNPRTAIGYYEPGHYVFVTVDGRQGGYSKGMKLPELSQLMYDLGCSAAFNLDGGASTQMAFMGEVFNKPSGDRMDCDILYITDTPEASPAE
jgi:exopolysaccharide biosynthesis protein